MSTRICLIGGSGFVGRAIVRLASEYNYSITVACRHPERARDLLVEGVRLARTDITDGRGLVEAIKGADIVINLVGLLFERGHQNFEAVHVRGTGNILAACKQAQIKQYLHMSALGAGLIPASSYARTKGEAEGLVRQSGLSWTIYRPSVIYGMNDSFFNRFKAISRKSPIVPIICGNTKFQPIWVDDVAKAFLMSIDNRYVLGETFELAGPQVYSFQSLIKMFMVAMGRKRLLIPFPSPVASIVAAFSRFLPTPLITSDQLVLLKHDNIVQGEAFPNIFGTPMELESILPMLSSADQATRLQQRLDAKRTRYLNRR